MNYQKTPMTSKERIWATVKGQPRDRIAVTPLFMQWAAAFEGYSYRDYYLNGRILADCQVAVARALNTDSVSNISAPWAEASAYGMEFTYPEDSVGIPKEYLLREPGDIAKLRVLSPREHGVLSELVGAVALEAEQVGQTQSVIGWVEGPLAEYAELRGLQEAMTDLMDYPEVFHEAAEILVESAIVFARDQVEAGADIVGVGDAAASLIGPALYREHVLGWERKLIEGIQEAGALVKLHVCGNISAIIGDMAKTGAEMIDVDWMVSLKESRKQVGPDTTLCGNFDPTAVLLQGDPEVVAEAARNCVATAGDKFILQPGCEVPPGTPMENLRAFCPVDDCQIMSCLRTGYDK